MDFEYKLAVNLDQGPNAPIFTSLCAFPWKESSIKTLWGGELDVPHGWAKWKETCGIYGGYVAAGTAQGEVYIYNMLDEIAPRLVLQVTPPTERRGTSDKDPPPPEPIRCIAWALLNTSPYEPVIIWVQSAVMCVLHLDDQPSIFGTMRGHGGTITALIPNSVWPNLVMSTSQDHTSRIWDLGMRPADLESNENPVWPGLKRPTLAGAPHGLKASDPETDGAGACVALLSGGLGGGHESAVLSGAWHPRGILLVATCGTDRCVKIWQIPEFERVAENTAKMVSALKPIFSSNELHAARVMSISWLQDDLLITHSAPALMLKEPGKKHDEKKDPGGMCHTPGTLCIWKWLSYKRYLPGVPANSKDTDWLPQDDGNATGPQTDYEDNSSFLIICELAIPLKSHILCLHTTGDVIPFLVVLHHGRKPALLSLIDILSEEQHPLGGHGDISNDARDNSTEVPPKRPFSSDLTSIASFPSRFDFQFDDFSGTRSSWGSTPDGILVYAGATNGRILMWMLT